MANVCRNILLMDVYPAFDRYMALSGLTDQTRDLRRFHLMRLAKDYRETFGGDLLDATEDQLEELLTMNQWSPNTRRSHRSSLRAFFKWAHRKGHVQVDPAAALPSVRVPRAMPRPASEEDYASAAQVAQDERVRLAARLGGDCAMRRGEIAAVAFDDLMNSPEGWVLRVVGKGGHERLVPVPDTLALDILYYQSQHGGVWLFANPSNPLKHLTAAHVGKLVSRAMSGGVTTHALRHRAATKAYAVTRDLRAVQEFLGHAHSTTTEVYTKVPAASIRDAMNAAAG